VLESIDHPFVVSLRFAFQSDTKVGGISHVHPPVSPFTCTHLSQLYMILDYFTGGELFFHLKNNGRFNEERAKVPPSSLIIIDHHLIIISSSIATTIVTTCTCIYAHSRRHA
jgi:serine/threonine protein kinase